jgi:hypothetical protein
MMVSAMKTSEWGDLFEPSEIFCVTNKSAAAQVYRCSGNRLLGLSI